eukprot:CAMPEP_0177723430 /NCGR_PEP_ID=MMETSP0484_2-20121128/18207_1 /TAXON_ID=354590 /ORGANISM="Rhodomonas lens, Strain RHODO" /LENGTH=248 /DNA_ID=CAMNT_0019235863 /DNA_START=289 /DNA_END=1032 /DNA_ORIENTATION=-
MAWIFGGRANQRPPDNAHQANHQPQPPPQQQYIPVQQPQPMPAIRPGPELNHHPHLHRPAAAPSPSPQAAMQYSGSAFGAAAPGGTLSFQQSNMPKLKYPELDRIHVVQAPSRGIDPGVIQALEVLKVDVTAQRASFRPFNTRVEAEIVKEVEASMEREKVLEEKRRKEAESRKKREEAEAKRRQQEDEAAAKRKAAEEEERKRREEEAAKQRPETGGGTIEAGAGGGGIGGAVELPANIPVFDFTGD